MSSIEGDGVGDVGSVAMMNRIECVRVKHFYVFYPNLRKEICFSEFKKIYVLV